MSYFEHLKLLSHHAYYLVGDKSIVPSILESIQAGFGIDSINSQDYVERVYQVFTIDDARELKLIHGTRPVFSAGKKLFVLSMSGITIEAQNALLKLLEEPAEYAHFILIVSSPHILLDTVKSRLYFVASNNANYKIAKSDTDDANIFIKANSTKKLAIIKDMLDDLAKEKRSKIDIINFLSNVEREVYQNNDLIKNKKLLENIDFIRNYLNDKAPSIKILMEYFALM